MGGFGSGRTGGWPTVEGCRSLVLSADRVTRRSHETMRNRGMHAVGDGRRVDIPWHRWQWTRSWESESWAVVEMRLELRADSGIAWLRYDVDHISRPTGPQHQEVSMV